MRPEWTTPEQYFAALARQLDGEDSPLLPAVVGFFRLLGHIETTESEVDAVMTELTDEELGQLLGVWRAIRDNMVEAGKPNMATTAQAFAVSVADELASRRVPVKLC